VRKSCTSKQSSEYPSAHKAVGASIQPVKAAGAVLIWFCCIQTQQSYVLPPLTPPAVAAAANAATPLSLSGVIKTSEKELYIEAEQRVPISPQGSWGINPTSQGSWASAAVIGSPVNKRDSSGVEYGCVGVLWGPDVQEGDPVGIITIEDVIEEVRITTEILSRSF
jgi:hypothetical protein